MSHECNVKHCPVCEANDAAALPPVRSEPLLAASDDLLSACEKHIEAAHSGDAQKWIESAETLEEAMQGYRDARKANPGGLGTAARKAP